jgi:hypothetical protein
MQNDKCKMLNADHIFTFCIDHSAICISHFLTIFVLFVSFVVK